MQTEFCIRHSSAFLLLRWAVSVVPILSPISLGLHEICKGNVSVVPTVQRETKEEMRWNYCQYQNISFSLTRCWNYVQGEHVQVCFTCYYMKLDLFRRKCESKNLFVWFTFWLCVRFDCFTKVLKWFKMLTQNWISTTYTCFNTLKKSKKCF